MTGETRDTGTGDNKATVNLADVDAALAAAWKVTGNEYLPVRDIAVIPVTQGENDG